MYKPVRVSVLSAKDNVVEFRFKEKDPELVYACGSCGGQLFYIVANPQDKPGENVFAALHRCFRCNEIKDVYGLFTSDDGEVESDC